MIIDHENEPVAFAEVAVYLIDGNKSISATISTIDGEFNLEMAAGKYFLQINALGWEVKKINLTKQNGVLDLGKVKLVESKRVELSSVEIVGERNQMNLQIDKRVFNVTSDLSSQGGSAVDVLQNIPSVSVDAEGNVSLRGSQDVKILIDGKPSGFASSSDALEQLQANMIQEVEVITNASARYEAQGEAGIINIVLKKQKNLGLNGAATIKGGWAPDDGISINGNYRKGKLNLFGSADYGYIRVDGRSSTHQWLKNADTAFIYDQGYQHLRKMNRGSFRLGGDYDINNKNNIGATLGWRGATGDVVVDRTYDNYTIDEVFLNRDTRIEDQISNRGMLEGTLDYTKKFDRKGSSWKTTLRYSTHSNKDDSKFNESSSLMPTDTLYEQSHAYTAQKNILLQSDLVYPVGEKGKVEAGLRAQERDFDNQFGYSALQGSDWISNPMFNDRFNYDEKVYAAYLIGSNTFGKLGVQAGLRTEYSEIFTRQYSENNGNKRKYLNFFPSVALSYEINKEHTLQMSYSSRINRPGQWALMPFMRFGDNRAMRIGNPDLDPELTDAYELGMLNNWGTFSVLSSVYYRHTKNKFDRISFLGSDGIIYSKTMNIFNRNAYGIELNANYTPATWIRFTSGFNLFQEMIKGNYEERDFSYNNLSWSNRTSVNMTLPQRWRFQLSGVYEAPTVSAQGTNKARYFMDFGMSKNILSNKATIGFNISDILNSRKWRGTVNTPELQSETMFQWRQRSFRLTFTYRLNQKPRDNESLIDKSAGAGEEM